jgi:Demerecviridae HNH endonuclease
MISRDRVCELLSYDPVTGIFTRLKSRVNWTGQQAGKTDSHGARQILLDGKVYSAHRLAWLVMTGSWPDGDIDHKDRNPSNNSWSNLRQATRSQNMQNTGLRLNSTTGIKGITRAKWKKSQRWRAKVSCGGDSHVAHFRCFGQAIKYAAKMRAELHGDFANYGV